MPWVEVWLGVLFGAFELEPGEEFYSRALWVKAVSVGREAATTFNVMRVKISSEAIILTRISLELP